MKTPTIYGNCSRCGLLLADTKLKRIGPGKYYKGVPLFCHSCRKFVRKKKGTLMIKQEIRELYGQSIYEIRLAIAMHLYPKTVEDPADALELADKFVAALEAEKATDLKGKS